MQGSLLRVLFAYGLLVHDALAGVMIVPRVGTITVKNHAGAAVTLSDPYAFTSGHNTRSLLPIGTQLTISIETTFVIPEPAGWILSLIEMSPFQ